MTDASGAALPPEQSPYTSAIDPAFSAAFNLVQAEEDKGKAGEGGEQTPPAGTGDATPTAPAEGAPAAGEPAAAPADGAQPKGLPSALDLIEQLNKSQQPADDGAGADGDGAAAEAKPGADGVPAVDAEGIDPVKAVEAFTAASGAIADRMEAQFKADAFKEIQNEIDEKFIEGLQLRPMQMVGMEVPSLRNGAPPEEKMKILDSQMAKDWQETVKGLIEDAVEDKVQTRQDQLRPMLSVIQDSVALGQNNPDLIPNTRGFDLELATRFVKLAKAYEVRTAKGVIGYGVNVQPLINELRSTLATERGANGEQQKQEARAVQQRQQAAAQPRTESGQFDAPQAGIPSKTGMSGEPAEDYSTFWSATGVLGGGSNLNI
ncbi:hypothetical protein SEA_FEDE_49 [Microbacterium phage Fede]|nr:hypothetical protein SEA_FEDE_49 [Microbacterium phage Fede]